MNYELTAIFVLLMIGIVQSIIIIRQTSETRRLRKTLRDTTDRATQAEFLLEQAGRQRGK